MEASTQDISHIITVTELDVAAVVAVVIIPVDHSGLGGLVCLGSRLGVRGGEVGDGVAVAVGGDVEENNLVVGGFEGEVEGVNGAGV